MKTYQPKKNEIKRAWHLVDAKDQVLGRLSSRIALLLTGKQKVVYSSHMDCGDYVVVINSEKVLVTGKKSLNKVYRSHSGYPGGYKEVSFAKMSKEHPSRIIEFAVSGMLAENRLKADRMARLSVFKGEKHKYEEKFK